MKDLYIGTKGSFFPELAPRPIQTIGRNVCGAATPKMLGHPYANLFKGCLPLSPKKLSKRLARLQGPDEDNLLTALDNRIYSLADKALATEQGHPEDIGPKDGDYSAWVAWGEVEKGKASHEATLSLSSRLPRQSSTPPLAQYLRDALDGVPTCFCSAVQWEVFLNKTRRINDSYKRQLYPTTLKIG